MKELRKVAVHECANFELDDGFGRRSTYCNSPSSGRYECGCKYVYAQQFCPFYKEGRLRGEWVVSGAEIEAAENIRRRLNND